MGLTEAENIKNWQEYTEKVCKEYLHDSEVGKVFLVRTEKSITIN